MFYQLPDELPRLGPKWEVLALKSFIVHLSGVTDFNIKHVQGREILDSRGNPTVEVDVKTEGGFFGRFAVPSGASTGASEAVELRDADPSRYHGKGVLKAVANVNTEIRGKLTGMDVREQHGIDETLIALDGTSNKGRLGANAILGASLAAARAAAGGLKIPLFQHVATLFSNDSPQKYLIPVPMANVVNAGKHGGGSLEMQEFMIQPVGAKSFREGIRWISEVYHDLKKILVKRWGPGMKNVGDEGGFSGPIDKVDDVLDSLVKAIEAANYTPGKDFELSMDPAASEFFEDGNYTVEGNKLSTGEIIDFYADIVDRYPIRSIEDPLDEKDWDGWQEITKKLGSKIQIVGDDLLVTNTSFIQRAIDEKSVNSLLLKVNQIGSLMESMKAAHLCFDNGFTVVVSHRSGETEDPFIADLVVGLGTGQIKTGAPARSDRNCKYNQLLRIEEQLGSNAVFGLKM